MRRLESKLVMIFVGMTEELKLKLISVGFREESGNAGVAVECVDIRTKSSGGGDCLNNNCR